MEFAENLALDHKFDKDLGHALKESPNNGGFHYFNTKKLNVIDDDDDEEIPSKKHFCVVKSWQLSKEVKQLVSSETRQPR